MAFQAETSIGPSLLRMQAWVWPVTAAIVMGGALQFWSMAALFWLATHPAEKQVVVYGTPPMSNSAVLNGDATSATVAMESETHARTN